MVNLNIKLPKDFLKEEVRCGYTVTEKMKEVWAVQLEMLCELDRVCKKYNLVYYADSGTLIGAIRHGGYIPWDDDIDVVMMRKDYIRLLEVADKEFTFPLFLQTAYSEKNYLRAHVQLRNSQTTGCILDDVNTTYNKGIFIDIFPLDNLPDDDKELVKFKKKISTAWRIINFPFVYHKNFCKKIVAKIIRKMVAYEKLFANYEKLCGKYNEIETERVSYIAYSQGKDKYIWKRKWFEKHYPVPFEFVNIEIPEGFDERLKKEYGDYMVMQQAPTTHGGVILSASIPYKEYFMMENERANYEKV